MDEEKERLERKKTYQEILNASTVGMALVSGVVIGGAMGYFLDNWLNTSPWLLFIFIVFGFIAGIKNAFYYMKKAGIKLESLKDDKKDKDIS